MTGEGQQPRAYAEFGPLAAHLRYVERASRKLARATFYGMARWQGRLERKQGFLGRIVDIGAELFAMSAVCVRAQMDADGCPATGGDRVVELAERVLRAGPAALRGAVQQLWTNTDATDTGAGPAGAVRAATPGWRRAIIDPSIPGPWVAEAEPGPSKHENVHRHIGWPGQGSRRFRGARR